MGNSGLSLARYVQLVDDLEQVITRFDEAVKSADPCPERLEYPDEIALACADEVCQLKGYQPKQLSIGLG